MNPIQRTCYFLIALQMIAFWMSYALLGKTPFIVLAVMATAGFMLLTGWYFGERNGRKTR